MATQKKSRFLSMETESLNSDENALTCLMDAINAGDIELAKGLAESLASQKPQIRQIALNSAGDVRLPSPSLNTAILYILFIFSK